MIYGSQHGERLCFEPLACETSGDCTTFDEDVAIFERALKPGQDRAVSCRRAEIGRAGDFRYFYLERDIDRFEMRWFDASGRLVAQRSVPDPEDPLSGDFNGEYCASRRWMGRIPAADATKRERLICGQARTTLLPPLEDLRSMLRSGLRSSTALTPSDAVARQPAQKSP
jgi:hypothetical protein